PTIGPDHRFSLMHAEDFARYAVALTTAEHAVGCIAEPDDGKTNGYTMAEVAAAAAPILGHAVRAVTIPKFVLKTFALLNEVTAPLVGAVPMVTRGKVDEIHHSDWVSDGSGSRLLPAFTPRFSLGEGLSHTLAWYRNEGWL
ncbi:MAG TPA: hypothetical protein VD713_00980, partial [Sphingomonadales bacterium]|nr:hypothetical protein [Sphingomonadales bacterium]